MSDQSVRVTSDGRGHGYVTVDGQDISRGVRVITVRVAAGHVPEVALELSTFDVQVDLDSVDVLIPDVTREALIALGWRAPNDV